jgi:hypothetical protein
MNEGSPKERDRCPMTVISSRGNPSRSCHKSGKVYFSQKSDGGKGRDLSIRGERRCIARMHSWKEGRNGVNSNIQEIA